MHNGQPEPLNGSTNGSTVLSIDPGLDGTGWAVWTTSLPRAIGNTTQTLRRAYRDSGTIHTTPGTPDAQRLLVIGQAVVALAEEYEAVVAAVEVPAIDGTYTRNRPGARSTDGFMPSGMKHLHRATGALTYALASIGVNVLLVPARGKKAATHAALKAAWPDLGRTNEDQRDAIVLGARVLSGGLFLLGGTK